ncbi:hypothetical protein [Bacillus thermotolerans]|uniref:hypothetical protein n=1 Tax=Bacillus thermotolerans TaxID=1221996 RepID=UPI001E501EF7|nr:hypothetical protein [Bacillus thermotolerans]
MSEITTDKVRPFTQLALPSTLDEALDQTKRMLVRNSYQTNQSSRKVASDLGISQTKASRLIREYCADLVSKKDS